MHEMSIVESLLDAVRQELRAYPGKRVLVVRVRLGALRLVVPAILQSCYEASIHDSQLTGSRLEVENVTARARCRQCRAEFPVEDNWFECPQCHTAGGDIVAGDELLLTGIELADKMS